MQKDRKLKAALILLCSLAYTSGCLNVGSSGDANRLKQILKSGNDALLAKRYDEAIRQFDAGLALSPKESTFLINKAVALRSRGVDRYNESIRVSDEKAKAAGMDSAKRDFRDAAAAATEAVNLMKSLRLLTVLPGQGSFESNRLAAFAARSEAMRLLASKFDKSQADTALTAMREYIELEPDVAKKLKAQMDAGQMLLDMGKGEQAAGEYRKALASVPDNINAILGVGLALSQSGDRAKYREAEVYLQRFVDQAPDSHPLKSSAKDTLAFMRGQNAGPQAR
jgi:tetratricopeptide (TPR) repeat protein